MRNTKKLAFSSLVVLSLFPACGDDDAASTSVEEGQDAGDETSTEEEKSTSKQPSGSESKTDESSNSFTDAGSGATTNESEDAAVGDVDASAPVADTGDSGSLTSLDADLSSASGDSGATPEPEGVLYAIGAQVYDGNSWLSYIVTAPKLNTHISLETAVEVQGRALAVGPDGAGVTYVTNGTTITRYRVNDSDELVAEEPAISFSGVGVTDIHEYGGQFVFESESKAYFFDGDNSQVVVWDPDAMTVGQPIPLDIVAPESEGLTITFSASPIRTDNQVITFVGLRQTVVPVVPTAVVVLDTDLDTAQVVTDERCGYVRDGALASDGWLYLATEAYASAYHRINESGAVAAPCLLRFDPEAKQFDSEFLVELSSLVDGGVAGSLAVAGDGSVYLKVLDEALAPLTAESNARVVASRPAWKWASLTAGDVPAVTVLDLPPTSGSVTPFTLGQRRVALTNRQAEVNGATITVSDISNFNAEPSEVIGGVDGLVFSITQLR